MSPNRNGGVDSLEGVRPRYATIDGRRLQYVDCGSGPVLLLIHGIGCNWEYWSLNVPTLARTHRVIAVDLPGFGGSEPLPTGSGLDQSAATVVKLLDHLGVERAVVVGHSLGGLVAWLLVAAHPHRACALVLVCAATVKLAPWQLRSIIRSFSTVGRALASPGIGRAAIRRRRARWLVMRPLIDKPAALPPALLAKLAAAPGFQDALRVGPAALATVDPPAMAVRSLLIWGARDPVFSLRAARALTKAMPNATLVDFPRSGHCPMLECPSEFNVELLNFASALVV